VLLFHPVKIEQMETYIVPDFTLINAISAVIIAFIYITISSIPKEPNRQKISAVIIAGAGAVYWSGGLGIAEYIFATVMLFMAFKGLTNYTYIGIAWLMHTTWDTLHHLYANPIVPFSASSSAGCAVCDSVLAIWFFYKAPSVFDFMKNYKTKIA
jgi:Family of unknown function (DUF6010)